MAGLQNYLNPMDEEMLPGPDPELDPAPTSLDEYMAVKQAGETPPPMPDNIPEPMKGPLMERYLKLSDQAMREEKAGLGQLEKYIQDYQAQPQELDYTPLAAWADSLTRKPGNSLEAAKAMRPESRSERQAKLMQLQNSLQQRRGESTQRELTGLNTQMQAQAKAEQRAQDQTIAGERFKQQQELLKQKIEAEKLRGETYAMSVKEGIASRERIAKWQAEAAKMAKDAAQDRADERAQATRDQKKEIKIADQSLKLGKEFSGDVIDMSNSLKDIETIVGDNLESYDPNTKTLGGKPVDLPGKSLPLVGRVYAPGSKGERLAAAFTNINNALLKARSGAAVTEQEYARLKAELGTGKFNTEEQMLESLQRFKRSFKETLEQKERSYMPETTAKFREQGGRLSSDLFNVAAPKGPQRKEWNGKKYELQGDTWVEVQ